MLAPSPNALAETVVQDEKREVLDAISSPGCAVAVWHRRLRFQNWIDGLAPDSLPEARLVLRPDHVEDAIAEILAGRIADCANRQMLLGDIALLSRLFARIMKIGRVRLRLDILTDDACTRFHLDNVAARLLCTYRGRGTEYGRSRAGEDPHPIRDLPTGSVGMFRGRRWPGPERSGVLHRSPRIAGLGETRLLLVIDPPEEDD